jgi:hypothetical protein
MTKGREALPGSVVAEQEPLAGSELRVESTRFWALSPRSSPGAPHLARFSRDVGYRGSPLKPLRTPQRDTGALRSHQRTWKMVGEAQPQPLVGSGPYHLFIRVSPGSVLRSRIFRVTSLRGQKFLARRANRRVHALLPQPWPIETAYARDPLR